MTTSYKVKKAKRFFKKLTIQNILKATKKLDNNRKTNKIKEISKINKQKKQRNKET